MSLFNAIFQPLAGYVGVDFENIILLLLVLGSLIFMARDFRIGIIILLLGSISLFMWFYHVSLNWVPSLSVFFLCLILLTFSLYGAFDTSETRGFV